MNRRHGYAVLSAVIALIVGLAAAIYAGARGDDGARVSSVDGDRPHTPPTAAPASAGSWVGAWTTAPVGGEPGTEATGMAGSTLRNVVHASVGGTAARVTLSNLYGRSPLTLTHASIAVAARDNTAAAATRTMRRLTFGGSTTVVIPPGGQVLSDPVHVVVPRDSDVLVTTFSPIPSGPVTVHPHARQMSYVAQGDHTEDTAPAAYTKKAEWWRYVTSLDVLSKQSDGTVPVLGDSITAGFTSTVGANHRWTDFLADRLGSAVQSGADVPRYSIVNEGISGNRVLSNGLARGLAGGLGRGLGGTPVNENGLDRFGRDILSRTNVKAVVIDLGVNDILRNPGQTSAQQIAQGLRALVRQAHAHGIKVIGATVMPFAGHVGTTPLRDVIRQELNTEIRSGRIFDSYVDFDQALRDPVHPSHLRPDYDSGDHLHPSDKGYARMAQAFDLNKLKGATQTAL